MRSMEVVLAGRIHDRRGNITNCDTRLRELSRNPSPERDDLIAKRRSLSSAQRMDRLVIGKSEKQKRQLRKRHDLERVLYQRR